MLEGT